MSLLSTIIAEPTAGAQFHQTPLNRGPGVALVSENYIVRDGALEMRPVLSHSTTADIGASSNPWPDKAAVTGGVDFVSILGTRIPIAAVNSSWARGGDNGAGGFAPITINPSAITGMPAAGAYWDFAQIYDPAYDANIVVGTPDDARFVMAYRGGELNFLTIDNILDIGAKCCAAYDNYLLLGNIWERASNMTFPQRIHWSDRGSASSFTGGLSGFEDILAATGEIRRIVPLENRLLVFFDDQLWQGVGAEFPYTFRFQPLDAGIGCPYRWTVTTTPRGVMFLARDLNVYLAPKEGGPPVPIGDAIQPRLRSDISRPERAFGVYDPTATQYELFYAVGSLGSYPRNAAFLDMNSGAWSMHSFTQAISFGFAAMAPDKRVTTIAADSGGTMYRLNSDYTSDFAPTTGRTPVNAYWEHFPFGGAAPAVQKSVNLVRVDYDTPSASSLTVRTSPSQGVGYSTSVGLALSPTSTVSQQPAYVRESSRYPAVRIEESSQSLTQRQRIHRLHIEARLGGR